MNAHVTGSSDDLAVVKLILESISDRIDETLAALPTHSSVKVDGIDHRSFLREMEYRIANYLKAIDKNLDAVATIAMENPGVDKCGQCGQPHIDPLCSQQPASPWNNRCGVSL